mmetsp:Transcript_54193/g.144808  ORF Transcript_54193/g.144808 Transcript_54193/m.144808 type:complete len:134 (-) Transcript_54193:44-445(-)
MVRSAPAGLLWHCVKDNSCFLRKSLNCPDFSAERGNLNSRNTSVFNGIANAKAVDVTPVTKGKKESIVLTLKTKNGVSETHLSKGDEAGLKKLAEIVGVQRPDLLELAKQKYGKAKSSFKKKKVTVRSRRAPK